MKTSFCQNCGQNTLANMIVCPQCGGRKFSDTAPTGSGNNENPSLKNKNLISGTLKSDPNNHVIYPQPAKHLPRFIAAIIDSVLCQGAIYIAALALSLIGNPQTPQAIFAFYFFLGLIISTLYYSVQHSSQSQATIGKRLMGLRLVTLSGQKVSLGLAILRIILPGAIFVSGTAVFALIVTPMILLAERAPALQDGAIGAFVIVYLIIICVPLLLVFGNKAHKTLFDFICKTRVIEA